MSIPPRLEQDVAEDAGIRLVFCENREQVAKFVALRERLPDLLLSESTCHAPTSP